MLNDFLRVSIYLAVLTLIRTLIKILYHLVKNISMLHWIWFSCRRQTSLFIFFSGINKWKLIILISLAKVVILIIKRAHKQCRLLLIRIIFIYYYAWLRLIVHYGGHILDFRQPQSHNVHSLFLILLVRVRYGLGYQVLLRLSALSRFERFNIQQMLKWLNLIREYSLIIKPHSQ